MFSYTVTISAREGSRSYVAALSLVLAGDGGQSLSALGAVPPTTLAFDLGCAQGMLCTGGNAVVAASLADERPRPTPLESPSQLTPLRERARRGQHRPDDPRGTTDNGRWDDRTLAQASNAVGWHGRFWVLLASTPREFVFWIAYSPALKIR
jgi:hypothetical protein